jgi:hypothetical protein
VALPAFDGRADGDGFGGAGRPDRWWRGARRRPADPGGARGDSPDRAVAAATASGLTVVACDGKRCPWSSTTSLPSCTSCARSSGLCPASRSIATVGLANLHENIRQHGAFIAQAAVSHRGAPRARCLAALRAGRCGGHFCAEGTAGGASPSPRSHRAGSRAPRCPPSCRPGPVFGELGRHFVGASEVSHGSPCLAAAGATAST